MIADDDYFDLPEDAELAFIQLEKKFRAQLDERLDKADNDSPVFQYYQEYINSTLAAAKGLHIDYLSKFETPVSDSQIYDEYRAFSLAVQEFTMQIRIRHSRRAKRYSVALDSAAKEKIKHHLTQLKELTEKLEISTAKRESILAKIAALEEELQRERTRFEVVAAFILECATVAGEAGEKLEPWRKWIDSIANLIGVAKGKDSQNPALPAPEERKKIEPPKRQLPPPRDDRLDSDIPF